MEVKVLADLLEHYSRDVLQPAAMVDGFSEPACVSSSACAISRGAGPGRTFGIEHAAEGAGHVGGLARDDEFVAVGGDQRDEVGGGGGRGGRFGHGGQKGGETTGLMFGFEEEYKRDGVICRGGRWVEVEFVEKCGPEGSD